MTHPVLRKLLFLALLIALIPANAAQAAKAPVRHDNFPLVPGDSGPRVAALQWLLTGHKPNAYSGIKPTLKHYTTGVYGKRTEQAVLDFKFRFGYPGIGQCTKVRPHVKWTNADVSQYFFSLIESRAPRPQCWTALAANRTRIVLAGQPTKLSIKLKNFELGQVGVSEPHAYYVYNAYFHLPPEAWCAIFQNYSMVHIGLARMAAENPWYVPSIINWASEHHPTWLQAKAKVGALVTFYGSISHIGYVIGVDPKNAGYTTVEGNWSNRVAVVHHTWNDHLRYFVWIPWLVHA